MPSRLALATSLFVVGAVASTHTASTSVLAQGVGDASWTPATSTTSASSSRFITPDDSIIYRTDATWNKEQADGLARYLDGGLRYTHEVNDRSNRLNATGYWASNYPDPAYDRDDDDGDGRWEEAEVISGSVRPSPGKQYTSLVQFSRWHGKRAKGECDWAWDRRQGSVEVLSQLSRNLLGEWQAERFTLTYDSLSYPRVGPRPSTTEDLPRARCNDLQARGGREGIVVTFNEPMAWSDFLAAHGSGETRWTAFEAIGSVAGDALSWTCGGPVMRELALGPCAELGVDTDGVTAAVGYLDGEARRGLSENPSVARVDGLRDSITGLLFDVGGFGVERPGLTVNDRYWDLFLAE